MCIRDRDYLINPVESRLASLEKPQTLDIATPVPADVKRVEGFITFNDEEMEKYYGSMGFEMCIRDSRRTLQNSKHTALCIYGRPCCCEIP